MPIDLKELGSKLRRYRDQRLLSHLELASETGIDQDLLVAIEDGKISPTGDQVLILADFFQCDYRYFVSNEKLAPFEQTHNLYRRYEGEFRKDDRGRVQEFLFLCESEESLYRMLEKPRKKSPAIKITGTSYKKHGEQAAAQLRDYLGYSSKQIRGDLYEDFREIGCHVFRRELSNSNISGLCIHHPWAGACLLVNYSEDIYRQRFSAAHEAAHALLDKDRDVVVSFKGKQDLQGGKQNWREVRANWFASHYLMPPEFLKQIRDPHDWPSSKVLEWANRLKVSTEALSIALKQAGLVSSEMQAALKTMRVPRIVKEDPELPQDLAPRSKERKKILLRRGLSSRYVGLCFEAYGKSLISAARVAEMLIVTERELLDVAKLFGVALQYAG
jgi:Zn-dependent peptidase ImmA (M78 family)/DNA-binding XRE family transcriptional regulator